MRAVAQQTGMVLAATAVVWGAPAVAMAHEEGGASGGFLNGMHHPVSGWDHIAAMVAVGLWGAQLGKPAVWMLPVAFPMMMAVGGFLGLVGVPIPGIEVGIALSAIVLGAAVACEWRPPVWAALTIVAVFAVFHGHAHGTELPEESSAVLYSIGFVISTGLLHAAGISIGLLHAWKRGAAVVRAAGVVVGLAGLYFLWGAVA